MKLRDLFRWRPTVPDPPATAPARRPDWPTMRPLQRVVSAPDLITAPDRFPDGLVSWRNPSQGGTLGHCITPDAPAGVSDGLAAASPRGELPVPAQPWWWPRPPAVQRRVPTSPLALEAAPVSSNDATLTPPPAIPVYPLTAHTLINAAGVEPPPPRLALPSVQRRAAQPEASLTSVADPDLSAGESPPLAPLPPVVAVQTEPQSETSAGSAVSWPGSQPDLPAARRLGLGTPLQRIPDATGGSSPGNATVLYPTSVQRQAEIDIEPIEMAPLVSASPPLASATASPMRSGPVVPLPPMAPSAAPDSGQPGPSTRSPSRPTVRNLAVQRAAETPAQRRPDPMESPQAAPTAMTPLLATPAPTGGESPTAPRRIDVEGDAEPLDMAPLVSDSPPITSLAVSPTPSGPVATRTQGGPLVTTPSEESPAGSGSAELSPSAGSPSRSTVPGLAVQRAPDTLVEPEPDPVESPSAEPTTATPLPTTPAPAGGRPYTVQRRIEADRKATGVAPLVSGSSSMASVMIPSAVTSSAEAAAGSRSAEPSPSPTALPLSDMDYADARRTVTYDSVAAPVVGLIGDRTIESAITDYAAAVASAGVPVVAPRVEQARWPAVQRRSTVEGQDRTAPISRRGMLATTAVQRGTGAGANPATQWPPDALAVNRSSPSFDGPASLAPPAPFTTIAPTVQDIPPAVTTELIVQRADSAETSATTSPTATSPSGATTPALPAGSTSPTEVDTLVRRLYDPIVRRLKAELQLDRERAGHSLDLRH